MAKKKKKVPKFRLEMGWGGILVVITGAFAAILWTFVLGIWVGKKVATPKEGLNLAALETRTPPSQREAGPLFNIEEGASPRGQSGQTAPQETRQAPEARLQEAPMARAPITPAASGNKATIKEEVIGEGMAKEVATARTKAETTTKEKENRETVAKRSRPAPQPKKLAKSRPRPYFALQVASFKDLKYAQREVIRWENLGYSATIKKVDLGPKKGTWYRVFVGKYNTISEARKGAVELAKRFKQKSYIRPVR